MERLHEGGPSASTHHDGAIRNRLPPLDAPSEVFGGVTADFLLAAQQIQPCGPRVLAQFLRVDDSQEYGRQMPCMRRDTLGERTTHGHTVDRLAEEDRSKISSWSFVVQLLCTACLAPSTRVSRFGPEQPARLSSASKSMLWYSVHFEEGALSCAIS